VGTGKMRGMITNFNHGKDDFDKTFSRLSRAAIISSIVWLVVLFGLLGFVIWVVVKTLSHFNII
jgi:hypothetical protein